MEKESLRVDVTGAISQSDHPPALGCALTHPSITTDFSEALLEMVTPPCDSAASALDYLSGLHQYTVARLPPGEMIWNASMPCILRGAESVRIGQYGSSFSGRMKHAYRRGLALRYGKRMQAIAGIHFNHSL
ncbi:MAG: glutamate--cysteine ligase, partial [Granulosicoccus sp.]